VFLEDDPRRQSGSELPPLPKDHPSGYRPGWQLQERLLGLGVVALGVLGLGVSYAVSTGLLPAGLPAPNAAPGLPMPMVNPVACMIPAVGLGSVALIVVGFRRLLDP
jgi:hypothetical protein